VGANADSDAEADEELEHGPMPLMPGYLLHSLAFIYTTEKGARVDEGFIGVGFVVGVPSTEHRSFHMDYIVTAYHVIRGLKHVTLRFNLKNGGVHIVKNIPLKEWMANPKVDIALMPVALGGFEFSFVPHGHFVDQEKMEQHKIGAGDEVCLIGRVSRKGMKYRQHNVSVLRFGNIALVPQHEETMFLVELRSIAGHSGSPVIVYCPPYTIAGARERIQMWNGFLLLGVNRGHINEYEEIVSRRDFKTTSKHWVSQTNMAMSFVAPAWHINDLLNLPVVVQHRTTAHAELKRQLTGFREDDSSTRSVPRNSKREP